MDSALIKNLLFLKVGIRIDNRFLKTQFSNFEIFILEVAYLIIGHQAD